MHYSEIKYGRQAIGPIGESTPQASAVCRLVLFQSD
jgi:hypothetical protein